MLIVLVLVFVIVSCGLVTLWLCGLVFCGLVALLTCSFVVALWSCRFCGLVDLCSIGGLVIVSCGLVDFVALWTCSCFCVLLVALWTCNSVGFQVFRIFEWNCSFVWQLVVLQSLVCGLMCRRTLQDDFIKISS